MITIFPVGCFSTTYKENIISVVSQKRRTDTEMKSITLALKALTITKITQSSFLIKSRSFLKVLSIYSIKIRIITTQVFLTHSLS